MHVKSKQLDKVIFISIIENNCKFCRLMTLFVYCKGLKELLIGLHAKPEQSVANDKFYFNPFHITDASFLKVECWFLIYCNG